MSMSYSLDHVNVTLHGKGDLANVIKGLETGRCSCITGAAQCDHEGSYKREARGSKWEKEV